MSTSMEDSSEHNEIDYDPPAPAPNSLSDSQNLAYAAGDLVWARMAHFAFWPAMVNPDPATGEYTGLGKTGAREFHVQLFGPPEHAWVRENQMFRYEGFHTYEEVKNKELEAIMQKKKPSARNSAKKEFQKRWLVSNRWKKGWETGVSEAQNADALSLADRLRFLTFNYTDKHKKKSTAGVKRKPDEKKGGPTKKKVKRDKMEKKAEPEESGAETDREEKKQKLAATKASKLHKVAKKNLAEKIREKAHSHVHKKITNKQVERFAAKHSTGAASHKSTPLPSDPTLPTGSTSRQDSSSPQATTDKTNSMSPSTTSSHSQQQSRPSEPLPPSSAIAPDSSVGRGAACDQGSISPLDALTPLPYSRGDLVWARMGHFAFWPAMVNTDPEGQWVREKTRATGPPIYEFHVQMFGPAEHAWVKESQMFLYEGLEAFERRKDDELEQILKTKAKSAQAKKEYQKRWLVGGRWRDGWDTGVNDIGNVSKLSVQDRLKYLGFEYYDKRFERPKPTQLYRIEENGLTPVNLPQTAQKEKIPQAEEGDKPAPKKQKTASDAEDDVAKITGKKSIYKKKYMKKAKKEEKKTNKLVPRDRPTTKIKSILQVAESLKSKAKFVKAKAVAGPKPKVKKFKPKDVEDNLAAVDRSSRTQSTPEKDKKKPLKSTENSLESSPTRKSSESATKAKPKANPGFDMYIMLRNEEFSPAEKRLGRNRLFKIVKNEWARMLPEERARFQFSLEDIM